jgi:hypothetical protein
MSRVAAAITIPVTNAAKQVNSRRSFRTTVMAASPCGPWMDSPERSALPYRGGKVMWWNFGVREFLTGSLVPTPPIG